MGSEYKLLAGRQALDLTKHVQKHLDGGWQLHGHSFRGHDTYVHQAVVRNVSGPLKCINGGCDYDADENSNYCKAHEPFLGGG